MVTLENVLLSFGLLDEEGVGNDISDKVVPCGVFSCVVLSLSLSSSRCLCVSVCLVVNFFVFVLLTCPFLTFAFI
jgi:hypothetical protein